MELTPREKDKLLLFTAALVAERRLARAFHNKGADQRDRFRVIELYPAREAAFGNQRGGEQQQLVFFSGSQFHSVSLMFL